MSKTMNSLLAFYFLLLSCSKSGSSPTPPPVTPPPVTADSTTIQYGTPYTQVPAARDVAMYQVNLRAFSTQGNFAGVQARLDSIRALGINVLYLMPVYPVGVLKSVNSPYCVKDYMGVNTEFGSLSDLRTLVSEAHKRNMAVLFDWVADHSSWDNSWISNKTWYKQDGAGNIISPPNTGWNDVAALNFTNTDMRKAMIKAMKYWVYQANIDGYRCDAADFVPFDFWQQAIDSLRAITTHTLLLFAEGTRTDHFTAGFQLEYGMGFYYNMVNNVFAKQGSVLSIDSVNTVEYTNATSDDRVVRYISNHDVDNSDGTPLDLLGGKNGSLSAFVVAATMKGVPMIYNGQEVACPVKLNFFNNSTPIDWTINPDITAIYKKIMSFRNGSDAIKQGDPVSYSSMDVCVFTKSYNGTKVLVIVNLRNAALSYTTPSDLAGSSWKDVFDGSAFTATPAISLQPYEYRILSNP
ncbi:MAG TPA: alpha-amylase family glycosyl hydrolase [Puia sp.]|nr:alpha-amylase family glycosyl hydrolase [Puia sp.]